MIVDPGRLALAGVLQLLLTLEKNVMSKMKEELSWKSSKW